MGEEVKFLKPAPGLLVRDPVTKAIIPETGMNCAWIGPVGRYWRRRVACGDMVLATEPTVKVELKGGK